MNMVRVIKYIDKEKIHRRYQDDGECQKEKRERGQSRRRRGRKVGGERNRKHRRKREDSNQTLWASGNLQISKVYWIHDKEVTICKVGEGHHPGIMG